MASSQGVQGVQCTHVQWPQQYSVQGVQPAPLRRSLESATPGRAWTDPAWLGNTDIGWAGAEHWDGGFVWDQRQWALLESSSLTTLL